MRFTSTNFCFWENLWSSVWASCKMWAILEGNEIHLMVSSIIPKIRFCWNSVSSFHDGQLNWDTTVALISHFVCCLEKMHCILCSVCFWGSLIITNFSSTSAGIYITNYQTVCLRMCVQFRLTNFSEDLVWILKLEQ